MLVSFTVQDISDVWMVLAEATILLLLKYFSTSCILFGSGRKPTFYTMREALMPFVQFALQTRKISVAFSSLPSALSLALDVTHPAFSATLVIDVEC